MGLSSTPGCTLSSSRPRFWPTQQERKTEPEDDVVESIFPNADVAVVP